MQFWQSAGVGRRVTTRRSIEAMTVLALASLVAPATTLAQNAYITNNYIINNNGGSNTVSVIDTATDTVISTIPVGNAPFGAAVTPDGNKVYITNELANTVSVIDTATNTVIGKPITVGTTPSAFGIFIQPAKRFAGTPGKANCHGKSVSALAVKYDGIKGAAATLGYPSVAELQAAIVTFCEG
jgi:YVTN family beta-propeller protein